jgi:(p)ppGpp synthase/HD superfamily hydrolase
VHRSDCSNIGTDDFESGRMIDVKWSENESSSYSVEIQINADDRRGLIAEVSNKIFSMGIPLTSVNARLGKGSAAVIIVGLEISDIGQLEIIFKGLKSLPGVHEVFRIHR